MQFNCPFHLNQVPNFKSLWDYLYHLQKCHLINTRIQEYGQTRNDYYFCQSCLQVFELITERDIHQVQCKIEHFKSIFKEVNKSIPLGRQGATKIQELINHYQVLMKKTPKVPMQQQCALTEIINYDQLPVFQSPQSISISKYIKKKNFQVKSLNTLSFVLLGGYEKLEAAYYKLYNQFQIEYINKEFPYKITKEKIQILLKQHNIPLQKRQFQASFICEFAEINIDQNPSIYLQILDFNDKKSIWLLVPEEQNFIEELEFEEPWAIFNFNISKNNQQNKTNITEELLIPEDPEIIYLKQQIVQETQNTTLLINQINIVDKDAQKLNNHITLYQQDLLNKKFKLQQLQSEYKEKEIKAIHYEKQLIEKVKNKTVQATLIMDSMIKQQKEICINKNTTLLNDYKKLPNKIEKLKEKVKKLSEQKTKLIEECIQLQDQENFLIIDLNEKQQKQSQVKRQIQKIKQLLCIQCKKMERNVIQYPCQHFLFCEQCFQENLKNKQMTFICPLVSQQQCEDDIIQEKYKTVIII